ncbi:hypothetical protein [Thermostaphylospora chromogena]|nr:hypothetical protein [Thermostaphylospora chromogena]
MGSGANKRRRSGARRPKPAGRPPGAHPPSAPSAPSEPGGGDAAVSDGRRFEALGRVMDALASETEIMESCRDLTWWRGADAGWHIEWRDGPHASEVAEMLAALVPSAVAATTSPVTARLEVVGIPFVLRAVDPLGRRRVLARRDLWRLAEALDVSRPTATRHPWEELLGG